MVVRYRQHHFEFKMRLFFTLFFFVHAQFDQALDAFAHNYL